MHDLTRIFAVAALMALMGCASVKTGSTEGDVAKVASDGPVTPASGTAEPDFPESTQVASSELEIISESKYDLQEIVDRCFGYRYGDEGYPLDPEKAVHWCREAALLGSSGSQTVLADLYYSGNGVGQDYQEALYWYTLADNGRHAQAALALF